MTRLKAWAVLLPLLGWVWIPFVPFSVLGTANDALIFATVASSLVLLTGWVGQISLAQAAFVGIGAFGTAFLARKGLAVPFPFSVPVFGFLSAAAACALGVVALRVRGLYLAVATLIFGWMADSYLMGSPWFAGSGGSATLEVSPIGRPGRLPSFDLSDRRIFYYAGLAGLALALVGLLNLRQSKTGRAFFAIRGSEMAAASLGIDVTRYKLLAFALSGFIAGMAGNLIITHQRTVVPAQFGFTISIFYLAVAVVGGLSSLGGAVASAVVFASLNELFFRVEQLAGWLEVVSAGLLAAVILFYPGGLAAAPDAFRRVWRRRVEARRRARAETAAAAAGAEETAPLEIVPAPSEPEPAPFRPPAARSGVRLFVARLRDQVGQFAWRRPKTIATAEQTTDEEVGDEAEPWAAIEEAVPEPDPEVPDVLAKLDFVVPRASLPDEQVRRDPISDAGESRSTRLSDLIDPQSIPPFVLPRDREGRRLVLAAEEITVRFGGLVAVDGASLQVREGEITGLIGANGAGKTTLFNAMAGFVQPQDGRVGLNGNDITSLPVHERARLGIGRTFQLIQLFPQLTVFENLLVATHVRNRTGFISHLVVTGRAAALETGVIERVEKVVAFLGLEDVADRQVAGLPFGVLRMVELARALVTGAPFIMLDEPASGLDSRETEGFANLLRFLRATLGLTLLLIEHDVGLVMSVCDYVYVLDRGKLIAEGVADEVRRDPAVLAAYLGTKSKTRGGNVAASRRR